jgi:hypothetical protein
MACSNSRSSNSNSISVAVAEGGEGGEAYPHALLLQQKIHGAVTGAQAEDARLELVAQAILNQHRHQMVGNATPTKIYIIIIVDLCIFFLNFFFFFFEIFCG